MAQNLTEATLVKSREQNKSPNIVLKIDGFSEIFGSSNVETPVLIGQEGLTIGQDGFFIGGAITDPDSRDYLSIQGSTSRISQQLKQDKGSVSSVTTINIKLIDVGGDLSEIFAPGARVADLLSQKATVYFMFNETRFPEDALVLLNGIITKVEADAASFTLKISHPEQLKRQELFTEDTRQLDGAVTDSATTITLDDVTGYVEPAPNFQTYVKIEDELLEYTAITGNDLTVTRGELNTIAASHDNEEDVDRFYRLTGNAIDIALKLMLSNPDKDNYLDTSYDRGDGNVVEFDARRLVSDFGITAGDNLFLYAIFTNKDGDQEELEVYNGPVVAVTENDLGTFVTIEENIGKTGFFARFTSRYNVWPIGLSMTPTQVDIEEHERVLDLFRPRFPDMDIYIKEQIEAKDFISKDLMFPNGLYVIPRKGRVSIGITVPPLADFQTQVIDEKSVLNPDKIKISRSVNQNFYNSVVYKFNEDSLEDDLLNKLAVFSATSLTRIDALKNTPLVVEARGFRTDANTQIRNQANAFLKRFQFAADYVKGVEVDLRTGFNIDVGDRAIFGSEALKVFDSKKGSRRFSPRVMEVVNKTFDLKGRVSLDLLDTNFTSLARYGVISPSSKLNSYTDGILDLQVSFTTNPSNGEAQKWERYIEESVKIYNADFSIVGTSVIAGLVDSNPNQLRITDPGFTVTSDMKMSLANYQEAGDFTKSVHCFWSPTVKVDTGVSDTEFSVDSITEIFVGAVIRVSSDDYTNESPDVLVESIDGTTITTDNSLGFTPSNGENVKLIGFKSDSGLPYRIL